MGCLSSKDSAIKDARQKQINEGNQAITALKNQLSQVIEQNKDYAVKISEMRKQMNAITAKIEEEETALRKKGDKDQAIADEIKALRDKITENEAKQINIQKQVERQPEMNKELINSSVPGDESITQGVKNEIYQSQPTHPAIKKDISNLFEVARTQQLLIESEVEKRRAMETQLVDLQTQLRLSKEFQLIQQTQIQQLSLLISKNNINNNTSSNVNLGMQHPSQLISQQKNPQQQQQLPLTSGDIQLALTNDSIEIQKKNILQELNAMHQPHGFQWREWRQLEEFPWTLSQETHNFIHEINLANNAITTAAPTSGQHIKKVVCALCYQKYISLNQLCAQLQASNNGNKSAY